MTSHLTLKVHVDRPFTFTLVLTLMSSSACYQDIVGLCNLCGQLSTGTHRADDVNLTPAAWQLSRQTLCAHEGTVRGEARQYYGDLYGKNAVAMGDLKERYFLQVCAALTFARIASEIGLPHEAWPNNVGLTYIDENGHVYMSALHRVCGSFVHGAFVALRVIAATGALSLFHTDPLSWTTMHFGASVPALFLLLGPGSMGILANHARSAGVKTSGGWADAVVQFNMSVYDQMEHQHTMARHLAFGQSMPDVSFRMHEAPRPNMYELLLQTTQLVALDFNALEETKMLVARGALNLWTWLVVNAFRKFLTDAQVLHTQSVGTRLTPSYCFVGIDTSALGRAAVPEENLGPRLAASMASYLAEADMGTFYSIGAADFVGSMLRDAPSPLSVMLTVESAAVFRTETPYIRVVQGMQFSDSVEFYLVL